MDQNSIINAIAKSLNIESTQIISAVKGDNGEIDLNKLGSYFKSTLDTAVEHARTTEIDKQKNMLSKSLKEKMGVLEGGLKSAFQLEGDLIGQELVDAVVKRYKESKDATLEADKVKTHPEYLAGIAAAKEEGRNEFKEKYESVSNELTEFKASTEKNAVNAKVREMALAEFAKVDIIDGASEDQVNQMRDNFINSLLQNNYALDSQGNPQLVNEEGHPLKNNLGHLVSIDSKISEAMSLNVIQKKSSSRKSPDADPSKNPSTGSFQFSDDYKGPKVPDNYDEALKVQAEVVQGLNKGYSHSDVTQYGKAFKAKFPENK